MALLRNAFVTVEPDNFERFMIPPEITVFHVHQHHTLVNVSLRNRTCFPVDRRPLNRVGRPGAGEGNIDCTTSAAGSSRPSMDRVP